MSTTTTTRNHAAKLAAFSRLLVIMDELRAQCPWDRKQTMESLRNLTIEETYELADARHLTFDAEFDAVISLCQGAFGLTGGPGAAGLLPGRELDEPILQGIASALTAGGRAAISAFSAYFQLRHGNVDDVFDPQLGVNHEQTEVRDPAGKTRAAELWTTCFTPRELRLMARIAGLRPLAVHSVTPGDYGPFAPTIDQPEFLLVVERSSVIDR